MKITRNQRIFADAEFGQYEDDIKEIGQEFTSENTSINSNKLPAIFRLVKFQPGTTNIDYGGGRFDNAAEYLTQFDVINLVYDPYNRSSEHNAEVIRLIREAGGADTATCSNVLNVIKEPEVRNNVLQNIKKLVKPGGEVYITVYEGSGNGDEGPTKAGYQLNRKTADYLDEIREVFPDAQRKGKLIVAHANQSDVTSARDYGGAYDIDPEAFFTKEELMEFGDDTASKIGTVLDENVMMNDIYIVDYVRVVIDFGIDDIPDMDLSASFNLDMRRIRKWQDIYKYQPQVIDEIVSQYNTYIEDVNITSSIGSPYDHIPEPDEPSDVFDDTEDITVHIDTGITVDDEGWWEYDSDDWARNTQSRSGRWISEKYNYDLADPWYVVEIADTMLTPYIPKQAGRYHLVADLRIQFVIEDIENWAVADLSEGWPPTYSPNYVLENSRCTENLKESEVIDVSVTPISE